MSSLNSLLKKLNKFTSSFEQAIENDLNAIRAERREALSKCTVKLTYRNEMTETMCCAFFQTQADAMTFIKKNKLNSAQFAAYTFDANDPAIENNDKIFTVR